MATTKDVERLPSGKLKYRGETFPGYNKPKSTSGESKKSAVLAKKGDQIKVVRFGDPNMSIKKDNPERRKSFRARHKCDTAKDKFTARYWSCKAWQFNMWNIISGAWTLANLIMDIGRWVKKQEWRRLTVSFAKWIFEYRIWIALWVFLTGYIIWMLPG